MNLIERTIHRLFNGVIGVSGQSDTDLLGWDATAAQWQSLAQSSLGIGASQVTATFSDWSPILTAPGGTFAGTVDFARYLQIGKLLVGFVRVEGTTASTPSYLTFTTPVSVANTFLCQCSISNAGSIDDSAGAFNVSSTVVRVYGDSSRGGWGDGTSWFTCTFVAEAL